MRDLILRTLLNGLTGALVGGLGLGLFGWLLSGVQGLTGGLVFGGLIGAISGLAVGAYAGQDIFWSGIVYRFGKQRHTDDTGPDRT